MTSIVTEAQGINDAIANPQLPNVMDAYMRGMRERQEYELRRQEYERQKLENERRRQVEQERARRDMQRERAALELDQAESDELRSFVDTYGGTDQAADTAPTILDCTFDQGAPDSQGFAPSRRVMLRLDGSVVQIRTLEGWSPIAAQVREDAFWVIGHFVTAQEGDDPEFSAIAVDRYSGIALIHTEPDQSGGIQIMDFPGQCAPAVRLF